MYCHVNDYQPIKGHNRINMEIRDKNREETMDYKFSKIPYIFCLPVILRTNLDLDVYDSNVKTFKPIMLLDFSNTILLLVQLRSSYCIYLSIIGDDIIS